MASKLTTALFIERARAVHGDKYDYSQVVYDKTRDKIIITCPAHGAFQQRIDHHLNGIGCRECGIADKTATLTDFIAKSRARYGDYYDYSQVVYINGRTKIKIICPEHGLFEQRPDTHYLQSGCPRCGAKQRAEKTTKPQAEFLAKAREAHGDRYDYSQTIYKRIDKKVIIICPQHGPFEQKAQTHLNGSGCSSCFHSRRALNRTLTQAEFITKAHAIHGDRYDYSQAVYKGGKYRIKVICPMHGPFEQFATSHLDMGCHCPKCAFAERAARQVTTLNEFVSKARAVHGDKYEYLHIDCIDGRTRVHAVCPIHGVFEQRLDQHLISVGCAKCSLTNWVSKVGDRLCSLYFIRIFNQEEEFYKVGITCHSVEQRFKHQLANYKYEILAIHKSYNAVAIYEWEQSILETFAHLSYEPRARFGGETECFSSCDEILAIFPL